MANLSHYCISKTVFIYIDIGFISIYCTFKKNTKEAGLLLMPQCWAQLSFSSLVVP